MLGVQNNFPHLSMHADDTLQGRSVSASMLDSKIEFWRDVLVINSWRVMARSSLESESGAI